MKNKITIPFVVLFLMLLQSCKKTRSCNETKLLFITVTTIDTTGIDDYEGSFWNGFPI
jgi:hypothetical protein